METQANGITSAVAIKLATGFLDAVGVSVVDERMHFDPHTYSIPDAKLERHLDTLVEAFSLILPQNKTTTKKMGDSSIVLVVDDVMLMCFDKPSKESEFADQWFYRCYEPHSHELHSVVFLQKMFRQAIEAR